MDSFRCPSCLCSLPTEQGLASHIEQKAACRAAFDKHLEEKARELLAALRVEEAGINEDVPLAKRHRPTDSPLLEPLPNSLADLEPDDFLQLPSEHEPHSKRARVEDVPEDEEEEIEAGGIPLDPFVRRHPTAGATYGKCFNLFETLHRDRVKEGFGKNPWAPFEDEDEWKLAKFLLMSGMNQGDIDDYLKLNITRTRTSVSYKNKLSFFEKIDQLPRGGAEWECEMWEVEGDMLDANGNKEKEVLELWRRDPVECIKDLVSNPAFNDCIEYAPKRLFEDAFAEKPLISEMWTASWWEDIQEVLPEGATVAPVILASDKTQLSTFSGDKSAWPVYLSIGNIAKATRRSPSARAMVLVGYLPVTKLECFSENKRSQMRYQLFHDCMRSLLEPLIKAGTEGVDMECGDGFIRKVFPILAAYIADHPEQCLIACCQENHCPQCLVEPKKRGEPTEFERREPSSTLDKIQAALATDSLPAEMKAEGVRPVMPFWADLPHCDIFSCLTPDILHQLHKGMFKDHTVKWATACVSGDEKEVDQRFRTMSPHGDLRYFKKGISLISQWTGNEYKNMEKIFLGVIAGAADERVVVAVRAILDFIYYAHFEIHTSESLANLEAAWRTFHRSKQVFIDLGVRDNFDFAKLHSLGHYLRAILRLGSADGYNTEGPERLHIDFAKLGYRASNRKEFIRQMARWLDRREAVGRFEAYLEWLKVLPARSDESEDAFADADGVEGQEDTSPAVQGSRRACETSGPAIGTDDGEQVSGSFASHTRLSRDSRLAPTSKTQGRTVSLERETLAIRPTGYTIAKQPPFPRTSASQIATSYGAGRDFLYTLETYLRSVDTSHLTRSEVRALGNLAVRDDAEMAVYKQVKLHLPKMSQVSQKATTDTIRAVLDVPAQGLHAGTPAHFSTVLVVDKSQRGVGRDSIRHKDNPISDLRVAQIRVIFRPPTEFAGLVKHPLAFVQWFTPLRARDASVGMYSVARSTTVQVQQSSVISIDQIVRTCHLIPVFGRQLDRTWSPTNVLERCPRFYLNPYLRHSDFVLLRFLLDRWLAQKARLLTTGSRCSS
ncbi:hypothetical protein PsYK624_066590 [Phanerochaete sordida]|uniref:Uncharacterized protein n=1 Tax=Phanerochaete sordida TaxID=48140 RepID=A0A9P3LDF1_9APHY|nr:hypothetical protein PsYK624_066590 [Phanerochaete sordida]